MMQSLLKGETRTTQQITEHYAIEKEIANKLRDSNKQERIDKNLYTQSYDELFRRVPHHQQLSRKQSRAETEKAIRWQLGLLRRFLKNDMSVVELGPGDCSLSFKLCDLVKKVYAIDVSRIVTYNFSVPDNFELVISDGSSIPLPSESIDIVYSNQLMEHVHPDDAREQLKEVFRVLRSNGKYVCITPNKTNGPWDISYYFDEVATGLHLKEYTLIELLGLFKQVGFRKHKLYIGARGIYIRFPLYPVILMENILSTIPYIIRLKIGRTMIFRMILGIKLVCYK